MNRMTTKFLVFTVLVLQAVPATAQLSGTTFGGIPLWADSTLRGAGLMLSSELNPLYVIGDFDRDGLPDIAVEVKDGSLRCGLAILHRIDHSLHIIGAGRPVGNGSNEIACGEGWGIQPAQFAPHDGLVSPDLLYVTAGWHDGGWLVWNGTTYVWVAWG